MTNERGHQLAKSMGAEETLGAYRGGNRLSWIPGVVMDVWVPCPRGEIATGVPSPHVYFVQTHGSGKAEDGSIYCPTCRVELAARRGGAVAPTVRSEDGGPSSERAIGPPQSQLPF